MHAKHIEVIVTFARIRIVLAQNAPSRANKYAAKEARAQLNGRVRVQTFTGHD